VSRRTPAPHVHVADPDLPADPLDRRDPPARVCVTCGVLGRPGDTRHTMPDPVPDPRTGNDT
jgi:hypothetical protein